MPYQLPFMKSFTFNICYKNFKATSATYHLQSHKSNATHLKTMQLVSKWPKQNPKYAHIPSILLYDSFVFMIMWTNNKLPLNMCPLGTNWLIFSPNPCLANNSSICTIPLWDQLPREREVLSHSSSVLLTLFCFPTYSHPSQPTFGSHLVSSW